ncbi:unnamed protein product [Pleuronectes platessa]|uniref:Uncharacterized protein n=1 Tax=Pleuronectes platessa TaxID=8262 RepID=A0A9N7VKP9_PLEPL|nr:unnamed protein product [Pleuronectes platessa]
MEERRMKRQDNFSAVIAARSSSTSSFSCSVSTRVLRRELTGLRRDPSRRGKRSLEAAGAGGAAAGGGGDAGAAFAPSRRGMREVTDIRKPVAATPPQEIMCLCVWLRRFLVLPGTTLPEPPRHWLSWLAVWSVTSRPDRSVKKEEEMFLYLECGHFISRIYSRSNTRITSRGRPYLQHNSSQGQCMLLRFDGHGQIGPPSPTWNALSVSLRGSSESFSCSSHFSNYTSK